MELGFEILPHTADMRMRVWGKNLKEVFTHALKGMASYLKPEFLSSPQKNSALVQEIKIEAIDINSLLVEFLSEAVAQSDIHNAIFTDIDFEEFGENFLSGNLKGIKVDSFDKDIKAVSYHEVDIKKNPQTGFYETMLVFDI